MSRNAALLIDLENFYLAREVTEAGADEQYDFIRDLERLCGFARELVGQERRLIVRRAYADFSASRLNDDIEVGRPRRDYFLRSVPTLLMDQGMEPVQVFRFPGGGRGVSKNAADMRLAMDAISLVENVDFFILVTGDKDFIPLVLELRQRNAYVVGLGAHGSIARTLTAYCDEFHEFEALVAADERPSAPKHDLDSVGRALRGILAQRGRLDFARVKPLLDRALGQPFDPTRFGSDTMSSFLRDRAEALGVIVNQAALDWEVAVPPDQTATAIAPTPTPAPAVPLTVSEPRPPTLILYRRLLLSPGKLRLHIHGYDVWRIITDHVYQMSTKSDGTPTIVLHHELRSSAIDHLNDERLDHAGKTTNDALFLIFKAGCFICADPGPRDGLPDFNWSNHSARLAPGITSAEHLRERAHAFVVSELSDRLRDLDGSTPDPNLVSQLLFGPDPTEATLQRAQVLIDGQRAHATGT